MGMREHEIDETGWPEHVNKMEVKAGQKVQHEHALTLLHAWLHKGIHSWHHHNGQQGLLRLTSIRRK